MNTFDLAPRFAAGQHRQLVLADGTAPEIAQLLRGATVPAVALGACQQPLQAMTTALAGEALETLHIVAHGRAGGFWLGGHWVDEAALRANAHLLLQWRVQRIALWSCEVGQSTALLKTLARLTGAEVRASATPLGWTSLGHQWELPLSASATAQRPKVAQPLHAPFAPATLQAWPHQLASYTFTNAYAVNTATTLAEKEQNGIDFDVAARGTAVVTDGLTSVDFSGNDVVAKLTIGGVDYFGWISRPIKSGGQVKGFYFWKDTSFTNLATATTDGNRDTDGTAADNTGFVLVVDQAYFDGQIGNSTTIANTGSSSDRVDSALNGLRPVNVAPVAVADASDLRLAAGTAGGPALEAGHNVSTVNAVGNVLGNDTDGNSGDTKSVLKVGTSSANTAVNTSTTSADGTQVTGLYGTLKLGADGSYQYVVNNTNATVQALRTTADTLSDQGNRI